MAVGAGKHCRKPEDTLKHFFLVSGLFLFRGGAAHVAAAVADAEPAL